MTEVDEYEFDYFNVLEKLQNNICNIAFYKLDGSVREMRATLLDSELPKVESTGKERSRPTHAMAVFDLDKQQWRSFLIENLISIGVE